MEKVCVGIDLGTKLGVAVLDMDGNRIHSETKKLHACSKKSCQCVNVRCLQVRYVLANLSSKYNIVRIQYEKPFMHMKHKQGMLSNAFMCGAAISFAMEIQTEIDGVDVTALKKLATGKGNAKKCDMMAKCKERWPEFDGDDNEADALWVALYGLSHINGTGSF